jgi:fluoride exporter
VYPHNVIWIAIGVGGAVGAIGRHAVNHLFNVRFGGSFPIGIFVINALGCFVIGLIAGLIASTRLHVGETSRAFIVVGVLGGFTTFSSYGLDTYTLFRGGHTGMAVVNAAGQVIVGLAAVWIGFAVGDWQ